MTKNTRRFHVVVTHESTGVVIYERKVRCWTGVKVTLQTAIEMAAKFECDDREVAVSVTQRFEDEHTAERRFYLADAPAAQWAE